MVNHLFCPGNDKNMLKYFFTFCMISCVLAGCGKERFTIDGFDESSWKEDNYGCEGQRLKQLDLIKASKEILLGKTQNQIRDVLGAPDEHELYERTRKFFYYYLEPSEKCEDTSGSQPRILQIRFSAMGISNELFVRNE